MKPFLIIVCSLFIMMELDAQVGLGYQKPHDDILQLIDAKPAPAVSMDYRGEYMVLRYRNNYKTIQELSEKELRLGGLRINPKTNISSRVTYFTKVAVQKIGSTKSIEVKGLPENPRLANFSWSPDQRKMSMTHSTEKGVELWLLDMQSASAKKLTTDNLNANMGNPVAWMKDGKSLLVKLLPSSRKALIEKSNAIPTGPTISENKGKKAQNRTYQDLLKDEADEYNFEQLALSDIVRIDLDGKQSPWLPTAIYRSMSFSPDGNYVMLTTVEKPFSYLVPYSRFPFKTAIYDKGGKLVKTLLEVPLIEDLPKGFMAVRTGMRNLSWRADKAATLVWVEALDGGDPAKEVDFKDAVFEQKAPFNKSGQEIAKTINRFAGIDWGNESTAILYDYWWNTRNTKTYIFNPSDAKQQPQKIQDRNYQDRYSDPGDFVKRRNRFGKNVVDIDGAKVYLEGDGLSDKGIRPFVDEMNLKSLETTRLWQADGKKTLESISATMDMKEGKILTRIESKNDYPNYYFRNVKKGGKLQQITYFENPFKSITNVEKEVIKYKREDGLELSGVLYLPAGYDKKKKEKLPMILWAYPREYKDKASAGQVTSSPNEFTFPWYGSPIYWVTRGYAVLDRAAFPIVGEGKEEPNDSFIKQLVANGKAAIDAVDELGYIDRNRVAVGGHSYGAFMTANLLSHSNLFAAGIARSGAYNRTLTPFGFQSEERNYWEAPEVYYTMSPFMHADKMKTPLLLIHGEADNNSGTYPMQSKRYFNALKGLGATVRLVMLPKESHGYAAKESIMHMLWEQDEWLEKYVKNRVVEKTKKP